MASHQHLPVRPARVRTRQDALRIVALRHSTRIISRPTPAGRLLQVLLGILLALGMSIGFISFVTMMSVGAAISVLSADLPAPSELGSLTFAQPTVVYD